VIQFVLAATQVVVVVQMFWLLKRLEAVRVEISSARWEWGRMARSGAYKRNEGPEPIGGQSADGLD
jgi:hypothetical protein